MLVHPWDLTTGEDEWRAFVAGQGFGQLIAAGRDRVVPVVVPTQYVLDSDHLLLHLATPNPIWHAIEENPTVLLSVAGDWAFIPSAWKAIGDEDPQLGIPTTYYAAVQLVGTATVHDERHEPGSVADVLRRQLHGLQPGFAVADPAVAHPRQIQSILGISIAVDSVSGKFKYGGNVDEAHRLAVVDHLQERHGPGDTAAADHLMRRLAGREGGPSDRPR